MTIEDQTIFDTANNALVKMGFRDKDSRQAISQIKARKDLSVEMSPVTNDRLIAVIRQALATLTTHYNPLT